MMKIIRFEHNRTRGSCRSHDANHNPKPQINIMKLQTLQDLLVHELKDLYSAENQLVKALPKMAKAATNESLKAGFEEHLEQTKNQVTRLEEIAKSLDCKLTGHRCKAMA